jgi:hypothetical protein
MNNLVAQQRKIAKIEINLPSDANPIRPASHRKVE